MGLLELKKEIESKLHFYTYDGTLKHLAAYISETDGKLHVFNDKVETKEESAQICEWYLKIVNEL